MADVVIHKIRYYEEKIAKENGSKGDKVDEVKLLRYLGKLSALVVTTDHLAFTDIALRINELCAFEGRVGDAAQRLQDKWQDIVLATFERIVNDPKRLREEEAENVAHPPLQIPKTRTGSVEDVEVISTNRKRIRDDDSDDDVAVVEAVEPPAREPKPRRQPAKKKKHAPLMAKVLRQMKSGYGR